MVASVIKTTRGKKTLAIMLFSGPYSSQQADHACSIAEKALDKGYAVELFLYGDGVHAQMKGQAPKAFFNIGESLERIAKKGGVIKSCTRCSTARGYVDGDFDEMGDRYPSKKSLDAVRIYSLYGFVGMIGRADRVLAFGSS